MVPKSYPRSAASHAVDGGIVVEVALARQREDLVLGPPHPEDDFNNQFQINFTKKLGHLKIANIVSECLNWASFLH